MAVHFYVTIPTEVEEMCLRNKCSLKLSDPNSDDSSRNIFSQSCKTNEEQLWDTDELIWTDNTNSPLTITLNSRTTTSSSSTTTPSSRTTSPLSWTTTTRSRRVSSSSGTVSPSLRTVSSSSRTESSGSTAASSRSKTTTPRTSSSYTSSPTYSTRSTKTLHSVHFDLGTDTESGLLRKLSPSAWEFHCLSPTPTDRKSLKRDVVLELSRDACMAAVLQEVFKKYQIETAVWTYSAERRMRLVNFPVEFPEVQEQITDIFDEWGIGRRFHSTVTVCECMVFMSYTQNETFVFNDEFNNIYAHKPSIWARFIEAVKSKLNVRQIVRDVRNNAELNLDFYVLIVASAVLGAFGLMENSTIFIFSCMLLSPLMGPIIASIFGTVINDRSLLRLGLNNELVGTLLATLIGFLIGFFTCLLDKRYDTGEGVTAEMFARCENYSLWVWLFTAIPSGAAAAVSILLGNISSLVGVAVSAAILPPAVNAGILWSLAAICKLFEHDRSRYTQLITKRLYTNDQSLELTVLGFISLCLALLNISCVYLVGVLTLKAKEKAPTISYMNRKFWKQDIRIARKLTEKDMDSDVAIMDEFSQLPKQVQDTLRWDCEHFRRLRSNEERPCLTWPPRALGYQDDSSENIFERVYATITNQPLSPWQKSRCRLVHRPVNGEYYESRDPLRGLYANKSSNINLNTVINTIITVAGTAQRKANTSRVRLHRFIVSSIDDSSESQTHPAESLHYPSETAESQASSFEWLIDSSEPETDPAESQASSTMWITDPSEPQTDPSESQANASKSQADRSESQTNHSQSQAVTSQALADPSKSLADEFEA